MAIIIDDMELMSNGDMKSVSPRSNVVTFEDSFDGLGMPLVLTNKMPFVAGSPSNEALVSGTIGEATEETKSNSFFSSRNVLLAISGVSAAVLLITLFSPSRPKRKAPQRRRRSSNRK